VSEQDGTQSSTLQQPTTDDQHAWEAYWKEQGQPWRTEPEIDVERQKFLTNRRNITPGSEQNPYPFKDITLTRADVEWLLATHENGRGPVDWRDKSQRQRNGLDLRGVDLRRANLSSLPMACLRAGLPWYKRNFHTSEQLDHAGVCLEKANLRETHLEGATLRGAHLEHADLRGVFLEDADLSRAHLEGANLREAHLQGTKFIRAHLEWADLPDAHLEEAKLIRAHLEGAHLRGAHLEGADLRRAFFDIATNLDGTLISSSGGESVLLAGIHWGGVDLTMLDWAQVKMLGDEHVARQKMRSNEDRKDKATRLVEYEEAVRANRQLAIALQEQGLNEDAARFAYRAQKLQRKVFWYQGIRKCGQYLFSLSLDLLAGYGYKPWRSFLAYLIVITAFATAYFIIGHTVGPALSLLGSLVFSMTSFHGRGFFPGGIALDDPLTILAAIEAFVGLLIEVTFIATLTQRLFGK
jgi:uncharacterized protein YjbI with pentapeptide repeats